MTQSNPINHGYPTAEPQRELAVAVEMQTDPSAELHPEHEDEAAIIAGLDAAIPVQVFQPVDPIYISDDDDEVIPI